MSAAFLEAVKGRRTYYELSSEPILSNDELKTLLETAVTYSPTAFNLQTGRAILFAGESNKKLWKVVGDLYLATLEGNKPVQKVMEGKIAGYLTGYGTIAYFEDQAILKDIAAKMPNFGPGTFETWSENSTGMLQYIIWTALEAEGYGASLQHHASYEANINPTILKEFGLTESWKCTALMPFGKPTGPPGNPANPKTVAPIENRVKVFA